MSSDEESEEEIKEVKVDMVEYNFYKAERNKYRLALEQWVRKFTQTNRRVPTDSDTSSIAVEIKDY